jgi:tRNA(fMet)-specific endonuclease VapC
MIYLLDTDTLVFVSRGFKRKASLVHRERARKILRKCRDERRAGHTVGLSAITLSELEFGSQNSGNYSLESAFLRRLMRPFALFGYDPLDSPVRYGDLRFTLERQGLSIGAEDNFIAAHALSLGATLVTNNQAHFKRVPGLQTVNWS